MIGNFVAGATVRTKFNTKSGGQPITLVSGAVAVYKDGGTTQSTAGVALTTDFDGVTGLHLVAIDTTADGTFYSAGSDFEIVLTAGTVDGVSQAGTVLDAFSIGNRITDLAAGAIADIRTDLERTGGMLQTTQGYASNAATNSGTSSTNSTTLVNRITSERAAKLDSLLSSGTVASSTEVADAIAAGSTQPRVNDDAAEAYKLDLVSMADGTYKAIGRKSRAVRIRPGEIKGNGIAVQVYTGKVFGAVKVQTVHAPTMSDGTSITSTELGPRDAPDPSAMVVLDGTATAGEEPTCTFEITMRTGERVPVTFDIEVFEE